jgi:hypothetical protein
MTITTGAEAIQAEVMQEQTQAVAGLALARVEIELMVARGVPLQQVNHQLSCSQSLMILLLISSGNKQQQGSQQANKQGQ